MNEWEKHLTHEQIGRLVDAARSVEAEASPRPDFEAPTRRHLADCPACERLVAIYQDFDFRLGKLKDAHGSQHGGECPSEESLRELAAGTLPAESAEELMEHAIRCEHCTPLLRQAVEDMADDLSVAEEIATAQLKSSTPEWQSELAQKMSNSRAGARVGADTAAPLEFKVNSKLAGSHAMRLIYAAAAILVGVGITAALWIFREPPVDRLLAEAYTEQRPMELRIAGAAPAPIRQQRGPLNSPLSKPASLLEAELDIKRGLNRSPNDERLLLDKGRAELLEWRYADAIKSFSRAAEIDPNNPDLLRDLATAYFQRADALQQPVDYGLAIDNLSRALAKKPRDPVCLFNRAIVLERMFLYQDAARDWHDYLAVEPTGPWSKEARQRLDELQERLHKHDQSLLTPITNPAGAVAALDSRLHDRSASDSAANSLDEDYLEIATSAWLADFADSIGSPTSTAPASAKALELLSQILEARHDDRFLADLLVSPHTNTFARAATLLSSSVASDLHGDPSAAYQSATKAAEIFRRIGDRAGEFRAETESVYALQRTLKSDDCREKGRALEREIDEHAYPWMKARLLTEEGSCAAVNADFRNAYSFAVRAGGIARLHDFGNLELRSLSLLSDIAQDKGDLVLSWQVDRNGLDRFWSGSFSLLRAYAFYADLGYSAEFDSRAPLAAEIWKEAVPLISKTPNRSTEGLARYRLGTQEIAAGDNAEASEELQHASSIFGSLPQDDATRNYRTASEVSLAAVEFTRGSSESAARRLSAVAPFLSQITQYPTVIDYYETLSDVQLQAGDLNSAEASLRSAVAIAAYGRATVNSDRDELGWERMTDAAYRKLVNVALLQPGREKEVLAMWELSRATASNANRSAKKTLSTRGPKRASLAARSSKTADESGEVAQILPSLSDVTLLTYVQLPDRIIIWAYDDRGIIFRQSTVSKSQFERTSMNFARLCADPTSDLFTLARDGKQLYAWLIAPLLDFLMPSRTLWIEPDAAVSQVPFQALVDEQGRYLAQEFVTAERSGVAATVGAQPRISSKDRILLMGSSAGSLDSRQSADPLADVRREFRSVSSHFQNPEVISGAQFDWEPLRPKLRQSELIHFAGHYAPGSEFNRGERADSALAHETARPLSESLTPNELARCKLVVLSACSTGLSERLGLFDPDGIVRPLLRSGAQLVVASRWDVDSAVTADLMDKFYRLLTNGEAPTSALRSAALGIQAQPASSHPFYWAAFEVFGSRQSTTY